MECGWGKVGYFETIFRKGGVQQLAVLNSQNDIEHEGWDMVRRVMSR